MRPFLFFTDRTASAVLNASICSNLAEKKYSRSASGETKYFTTYAQVVNFLLKKYATDEAFVKTKTEMMNIAKPSGMLPFQYAKDLLTKTFRCINVYERIALNEIFIKGFDASPRQRMREYREGKKEASLQDNAFHATTLLKLQGHDRRSNWTNQFTKEPQTKCEKLYSFYKSGVSVVQSGATSSPSPFTKRTWDTALAALDTTAQLTPSNTISLLIASLDALLATDSAVYSRVCLSRNHKSSHCNFGPEDKRRVFRPFRCSDFKELPTRKDCAID